MNYKVLSILASILLTSKSLFAEDFSLQVSQESLVVLSAKGETVAQISQGTVGKQINVGGSEFLLSFGKDVRNNLSAIVSPVLDKNSPLSFSTLNKSVKTDGNAIVSIKYAPSLLTAEVDGGFIGRVFVAEAKGYTPATVTPASLVSDVKPMSTQDKAMPKISINESSQKSSTMAEKPSVKSTTTPKTKVASSSPAVTLPKENSMKTQGEGKSLFAILKEEGVKGLFNSKHMVAGLERSKKSKQVSLNQSDLKKATPMGGMKTMPPEIFAKAANDKTGEIRLLQVKGSVQVDGKSAVDGGMVSQKSVIKTAENGSAVAVIGGLHLVTIHPNSSVSVTQELKEKQMKTLVDLKSGNIFADVNHRKGMTQDFKIKTEKGAVSATGSKALVFKTPDGTIGVIVFESTWSGTNSSGANVMNVSPVNAPADAGIKIVSFGSAPAMPGNELQNIVNTLAQSIQNSIVQSSSGNFTFVADPVFSFLTGNSPTLPDGTPNPGATIEGKLRGLILAITDVVVTEEKDGGQALVTGGTDPTEGGENPIFNTTGGTTGGANITLERFQPVPTSPGGS